MTDGDAELKIGVLTAAVESIDETTLRLALPTGTDQSGRIPAAR